MVLQEQERLSWQRPVLVRQMFPFFTSQALSFWRCLLELVLRESETCLRRPEKKQQRLSSLMKLTQLVRNEVVVEEVVRESWTLP